MIMFAIEDDEFVKVYNEKKTEILNIKGKLYNYTTDFIAIRRMDDYTIIDIYKSDGQKCFTYPFEKIDCSNIVGMAIR